MPGSVRTPTSLAELAELAGVATSTVSRALAGNPRIRLSTRHRIAELAREHGFQFNQTARNLRLKRTGAIGVVLPLGHERDQHLSDPFFIGLLGPLADAISERGYDLLLSRVLPRDAGWLDAIVGSGRTDGVIVIGQSDQSDVIEQVALTDAPLVIWGASDPAKVQITVGSDNEAGGSMAAAYLIRKGCRRLAFFGNPSVPEFAARYQGCLRAAQEWTEPVEVMLHPVHLTTEAAYAEIAGFIAERAPPDGIVAASDVIAMSALRALSEAGFAVPGEVSVVGYDDVSIAQHTSPPLTTIRQDVGHGAQLLVDLLFRRMAGEQVASVAMPPKLVVRGSA